MSMFYIFFWVEWSFFNMRFKYYYYFLLSFFLVLLSCNMVFADNISEGVGGFNGCVGNISESIGNSNDNMDNLSRVSFNNYSLESMVDDLNGNVGSLNSSNVSSSLDKNNVSIDSSTSTGGGVNSILNNNVNRILISNSIISTDIVTYYASSTKYVAFFKDLNGDKLSNTSVQIKINKITYRKKTDNNGVVKLDINLNPGFYKIISYNPFTGFSLTTSVKILSTIKAGNLSRVVGDDYRFTARFLNSNGKFLVGNIVKFKLNGKFYKVKTNSKGLASLSLKKLRSGFFKIFSYNVDGLSVVRSIHVFKSSKTNIKGAYKLFYVKDKKLFKVRLLDRFNHSVCKKSIVLKIGGKSFKSRTNGYGWALFKLSLSKVGVYSLKFYFGGDKFYKKSAKLYRVGVISSSNLKFQVKSTKVFGYGAGTQFKVKLSVGNIPVEARKVFFKVNGKKYVRITDKSGFVALKVNLNVGMYKIIYSVKGDGKIKSKWGSCSIVVRERLLSNISWISSMSFRHGIQCFKVQLKSQNRFLSSKKVTLLVGSRSYSGVSSSDGVVCFNCNLVSGNYSVSFKFGGDNFYKASSGSVRVNVLKVNHYGFGYYVLGSEMKKVDLNRLAYHGVGDVFLNYYALKLYGKSGVEKWISSAGKLGIRVHIWMQVFKDGGGWRNPGDVYRLKIIEAMGYAKVRGVCGVHLDYLRYNGDAYKYGGNVVSSFVREVSSAVHGIDSGLIVSCSVMGEVGNLEFYYGQDYRVISECVDVVVPLVYKGNYGKGSDWVVSTAGWFFNNSRGASVWVALQGYVSDFNLKHLPVSDVLGDMGRVLDCGCGGAFVFRYSLSNLVDFNSLSFTSVNKNNSPSPVFVNNTNISSNSSVNGTNSSSGVNTSNSSSSGTSVNDINSSSNINTINSSSNVNGSDVNATNSSSSVNGSSGVDNNNISSGSGINGSSTTINGTNSSSSINTYDTFSISEIIDAAYNLKGVLSILTPKTVDVSGKEVNTTDFLYLMAKSLNYLQQGIISKEIRSIPLADVNNSDFNVSGVIFKGEYLNITTFLCQYVEDNNVLPDFFISSIGMLGFNDLIDSYVRILSFYKDNNLLPVYVNFPVKMNLTSDNVSFYSVVDKSSELCSFFEVNKYFLSVVSVDGGFFSLCEFVYLMSKAIVQINNSNFNPIKYIKGIDESTSPLSLYVSGRLLCGDCVSMAYRVLNFIELYGCCPNYANSNIGQIPYLEIIKIFCEVLSFYKFYSYLPVYVDIKYP